MKIINLFFPAGMICFLLIIFSAGCREHTGAISQDISDKNYIPEYHVQKSTGFELNTICYKEGLGFAIAGKDGHILFSPDGQNWQHKVIEGQLVAICANALGFVAVGNEGVIMFSKTGKTWEQKGSGITSADLTAVSGTNAGFVAVGKNGRILYSSDGMSWTLISFPGSTANLNSVFGTAEHGFVAVGDSTTLLHSPDGINWNRGWPSNSDSTLVAVSGNENGFVAAGKEGQTLFSVDGNKWELSPAVLTHIGTVYSNKNMFLVAGDDSLKYSTNGRDWKNASGIKSRFSQLYITGNSKYLVAIADFGEIYRSADGKNWTPEKTDDSNFFLGLLSVACNENTFIVVGEDARVCYSENGTNWAQDKKLRNNKSLHAACSNQKGAIAVGDNGIILYSSDYSTWDIVSENPAVENLVSSAADNNIFVAAGKSGSLYYSEDGKKWFPGNYNGPKNNINAVCNRGSSFVAVGDSGTILYSTDGKVWTKQHFPDNQVSFFAVTSNREYFVATSDEFVIYYSTNGDTWEKSTLPEELSNDKSNIGVIPTSGNLFYLFAGDGEFVYTSANCRNWTRKQKLELRQAINSVCKFRDGFLVNVSSDEGNSSGYSQYYSNDGETYNAVETGNFSNSPFSSNLFYGSDLTIIGLDNSDIYRISPGDSNVYYLLPDSVHITRKDNDSLEIEFSLKSKNKASIKNIENYDFKLQGVGKASKERTKDYEDLKCNFYQPDAQNHPLLYRGTLNYITLGISPDSKALNEYYLRLHIIKNNFDQTFDLKDHSSDYFRLARTDFEIFWDKYRWLVILVCGYYSLLLLIWLLLPLLLFKMNERLPLGTLISSLPVPFNIIFIFLNLLFPVSWLAHNKRCLNAWVRKFQPKLKTAFLDLETVRLKSGYVPLPLRLNDKVTGELIEKPKPDLLKKLISNNRNIVQVIGSGGSGKTTLACEIGRWLLDDENLRFTSGERRIPFLLEKDTTDIVKLITEEFTGWLNTPVKRVIIEALLKENLLVVIIDALSEMKPETIAYFEAIHGTVPVNSLLITGRNEFNFRAEKGLKLYPQPLTPSYLLHFITSIMQKFETDPFPEFDDQMTFAQKIGGLFKSGNKDLPIVPILVKIIADNIMERFKNGQTSPAELLEKMPVSIPQVYFDYLEFVNPEKEGVDNYLPKDLMFKIVVLMGKLSLGDSFVPHDFPEDQAEVEIRKLFPDLKADAVERLIKNGILVRKGSIGSYFLRFNLDPLAEYTGAKWWADFCGSKPGGIKIFIDEAVNKLEENAKGFRTAFLVLTDTESQYGKIFGWGQ